MKGVALREAIIELLTTHPKIRESTWGHTKHALRFISEETKAPIAFEPERVRFQNIWVTAPSVDLRQLADIKHEAYDHTIFWVTKPNHALFGDPFYKGKDLICFKVTTLWQAVRVISQAAGEGHP